MHDTPIIGLRRELQSLEVTYGPNSGFLVEAKEGHTEKDAGESGDGNPEYRRAELDLARRQCISICPVELGIYKDFQRGKGMLQRMSEKWTMGSISMMR